MKKYVLALALVSGVSSFAIASATIATVDATSVSALYTTMSPTLSTACAAGGCKVIVDAKDDLTNFVASEGDERTAKVNKALHFVRSINQDFVSSDLEIATDLVGSFQ